MPIRVVQPDLSHDVLLRGQIPDDPRSVLANAVAQRLSFICAMGMSDAAVFDKMPGVLSLISDDIAQGRKVRNVARAVQRANGPVLIQLPLADAGRVRQRLCSLQRLSGTNGRAQFVIVHVVPDRLMNQVWAQSHERGGDEPEQPETSTTPTHRKYVAGASIRGTESEAELPEWSKVVQSGGSPWVKRVFVGESRLAKVVRFEIGRSARLACPVLVYGLTGTGKSVIAKAIHDESPRAGRPFVHVNCGGISAELLESQFFGHERGSFTSAVRDHLGFWREARGGTIFLDEIGDLRLESQAMLLKVFDTGLIRPIGSTVEIRANVRIIAATNKNLKAMVARGDFRFDLYMRLKGRVIKAPSLAEHAEDIPAIVADLWNRHGEGLAPPTPDAVEAMMNREWPGNVRELERCLEALADPQRTSPVTAAELQNFWASQDDEPDELDSGDVGLDIPPTARLMAEYSHCQRHLDAASFALRAAQLVMRGPMRGSLISRKGWNRLAREMHARTAVLERLCKDTAGFRYTAAFKKVRTTKNLLWQVAGALATSPSEAVSVWGKTVERETDEAIELLMLALQALHAEFFPGTPGTPGPTSPAMETLLGLQQEPSPKRKGRTP